MINKKLNIYISILLLGLASCGLSDLIIKDKIMDVSVNELSNDFVFSANNGRNKAIVMKEKIILDVTAPFFYDKRLYEIGRYSKDLTIEEQNNIQQLLQTVLDHPSWFNPISQEQNLYIKFNQSGFSAEGFLVSDTLPEQDRFAGTAGNIPNDFLMKRDELIPIKVLHFSHFLEQKNSETRIVLELKNLGQENISIINPLLWVQPPPERGDQFGIQIRLKSTVQLEEADHVIFLSKSNVASKQSLDKNIQIKVGESKQFVFILNPEEAALVKAKYKPYLDIKFPFFEASEEYQYNQYNNIRITTEGQ